MATLSRPDDNTVQANSIDINGMTKLLQHLRLKDPALAKIPTTTARRKIVAELKRMVRSPPQTRFVESGGDRVLC